MTATQAACPAPLYDRLFFESRTPTRLGLHVKRTRLPPHSSSLVWPPAPLRSSMAMILTTRLVQPVKCCVRWPSPVSGLYCSQAKPVSFQLLKMVSTRFLRRRLYRSLALAWLGPDCLATFYFCLVSLRRVEEWGRGCCEMYDHGCGVGRITPVSTSRGEAVRDGGLLT